MMKAQVFHYQDRQLLPVTRYETSPNLKLLNVSCLDINGDGSIDDPNEIIRYRYDSANRYITRSTNCGGAQAFLGDTNANQNIKTVLVENNNAGIPVFRYFNGSGTDISANVVANPADPLIGIPAIRRIEITLVADTSNADVGSNTRRRIIYSTSVIPRNHFALIYE